MPLYSVINLANQPLNWAALTGSLEWDDDSRIIDVSRCDKIQAYVDIDPAASSTDILIGFFTSPDEDVALEADFFQNTHPSEAGGVITEQDATHQIVVSGGVAEKKNFIIDTPGDKRMIVKAGETGDVGGVLAITLVGVVINHS